MKKRLIIGIVTLVALLTIITINVIASWSLTNDKTSGSDVYAGLGSSVYVANPRISLSDNSTVWCQVIIDGQGDYGQTGSYEDTIVYCTDDYDADATGTYPSNYHWQGWENFDQTIIFEQVSASKAEDIFDSFYIVHSTDNECTVSLTFSIGDMAVTTKTLKVNVHFVEETATELTGSTTYSTATATWEDDSDNDYTESYKVYYKIDDGSWSVKNVGTAKTHTVTGLEPDQVVQFYVKSLSEDNYTIGTTGTISVTTPTPPDPNEPSITDISNGDDATSNTITIDKNDNDDDIVDYNLYYRKSGSTSWTDGGSISGTTITLAGLDEGQEYDYYVKATNIVDASTDSEVFSHTTNGEPTLTVNSDNIYVSDDTSTVKLYGTVSDINDDDHTATSLKISATIDGVTKTCTVSHDNSTTITGEDWSLTWDTSDFTNEFVTSNITVSVDDQTDKDNNTNTGTYTGTIYNEKPEQPSISGTENASNGTSNTITIDKNGNESDSTIKHYLYYKKSSGSSWSQFGSDITGTEITHTGLDPGIEYDYYIKAVNSYDATNSSDTASQYTNGAPTITVNSDDVYLSDVNSTVTLTGTLSDVNPGEDKNTNLKVSATINGVLKETTISHSNTVSVSDVSWSLTWSASDFASEFVGTGITVTADDQTGKDNSTGTGTYSGNLYYDKTAPLAPTNTTQSDWTSSNVTITSTASDPGGEAAAQSGVSYTQVDIGDGWETLDGTQVISEEGILDFSLRANDKAGNVSAETAGQVKIDRGTPYNGSFDINVAGDADSAASLAEAYSLLFSDSATVDILNIYGQDLDPGVDYYALSNNAGDVLSGTWYNYTDYTSFYNFVLTGGEGTNTVYMGLKDGTVEGNTNTFSETIIQDTVAPTIAIGRPSSVAVRNGGVVSFTVEGVDELTDDIYHFETFDGVNVDDISKLELVGIDIDHVFVTVENVTATNTDYKSQDNERIVTITIPQDFSEEEMVSLKVLAEAASDKAGNLSIETQSDYSFIIDTTAPDYQNQVFASDLTVQGGSLITLDMTSVGAGGESADSIRFASVDYASEDYRNCVVGATLEAANASTVTSTHGTSDSIIAPVEDGDYYLYIVDAAGNISLASTAVLTIENEGPAIAIGEPSDAYIIAGETVTYKVVYSGEESISLSQEDVSLSTTGTANGQIKIEDIEGNDHAKNIVVYNISGEGTLAVKVGKGTAVDEVGNLASGALPSTIITIDATAPTITNVTDITTTNADANKATGGDDVSLTFTTTETIGSYTVMIGGMTAEVENISGTSYKATISIDVDTELPEEEFKYSIIVADAAGNSSGEETGNTGITLYISEPELTVSGYPQEITFTNGTASLTNESTGETTAISSGYTVSDPGSYSVTVTSDTGRSISESFEYEHHLVLLAEDKDALDIIYQSGDDSSSVTRDITLVSEMDNRSTVTWAVISGDAITSEGVVTRPTDADTSVTLEATLLNSGGTDTKTFVLTVEKEADNVSDQLAEEKLELEILYHGSDSVDYVTNSVYLANLTDNYQFDVTWVSNHAAISISETAEDGYYTTVVTRPDYAEGDQEVTLTATLTGQDESANDVTTTKAFEVTVIKNGTDEQFVEEYLATVALSFEGDNTIDSVDQGFSFTYDIDGETEITFASSNLNYVQIDNNGVATVTLPAEENGNQGVSVSAILSRNGTVDTKVFGITVEAEDLDNQLLMEKDMSALEIGYFGTDSASEVTGPIILATEGDNGSSIEWSSDYSEIVLNDGSVIRPIVDTTVTLRATFTNNDVSGFREFEILVKALDLDTLHKLEYDYNNLFIGYANSDDADNVTGDIILYSQGVGGSDIAWSSADTSIISDSGVVNKGASNASVVLTAEINLEGYITKKTFTLTVLAAEE